MFKIGDMVRVRKDSSYSNQREYGVGRIEEDRGRGIFKWCVKFKNYEESRLLYNNIDLELAGSINCPNIIVI